MPSIFVTIDKLKPFFDFVHKIVLVLCKVLLIINISITVMAVTGRYVKFVPDPAWSEEIVLSCMVYVAMLSAAIAIRKGKHIRMTALDPYLNKTLFKSLDVLADIGIMIFGIIMIVVGWRFAHTLGSRGTYVSMPSVSRFWMYFPIPLAGIAMVVFQLEVLYKHIKAFFIDEGKI
jgi:TRAP-type C4-dicarboxylate transport system permease small subunit